MNPIELRDILDGCKKGDRMCQKALYRHFYNYGMNVCNRYCKTSIEAEEIFNDAFSKILTKISQYNIELPFSAWMHTILIRSAINYLKNIGIDYCILM